MLAMKLALAMGRPDVDAMLGEIDADQFAEWGAFLTIHPTGWDALNLAVGRLAHAAVQPHVKKRLKESDFLIDLTPPRTVRNPVAFERARAESAAIRSRVRGRAI